jgi:hypothetical protein
MFNVGDEVVCVNDTKNESWSSMHFPNWVKQGAKYTIREILDNDNIVTGVLLEELVNPEVFQPLISRTQECAFATWRFEKHKDVYMIKEDEEVSELDKQLEEIDLDNL